MARVVIISGSSESGTETIRVLCSLNLAVCGGAAFTELKKGLLFQLI